MVPDDETRAKLAARRELLEDKVLVLDGKQLWFQENNLQFPGVAHITTDEWGVTVRFDSEHWPQPLDLSARWDFMFVHADHIGGRYSGWSISIDCPYPELGINSDHQI